MALVAAGSLIAVNPSPGAGAGPGAGPGAGARPLRCRPSCALLSIILALAATYLTCLLLAITTAFPANPSSHLAATQS